MRAVGLDRISNLSIGAHDVRGPCKLTTNAAIESWSRRVTRRTSRPFSKDEVFELFDGRRGRESERMRLTGHEQDPDVQLSKCEPDTG